jgi:ribosome-binding factor A
MADEARVRKVQDRIQETVARLVGRRIKDPRLGFVTITDVRVTGDLQHASIFYTVLGDEDDRKATARALESAKGLIRSEVGKALGIRLTPSLEFIPDALPETAASLEGALSAARARDAKLAEASRGATYAGDADPYRRPEEDEDDEDSEDSEDRPGGDAAAAEPSAPTTPSIPGTGDAH